MQLNLLTDSIFATMGHCTGVEVDHDSVWLLSATHFDVLGYYGKFSMADAL